VGELERPEQLGLGDLNYSDPGRLCESRLAPSRQHLVFGAANSRYYPHQMMCRSGNRVGEAGNFVMGLLQIPHLDIVFTNSR
jgi:hypothetical protein